jgi:hypothetical protein
MSEKNGVNGHAVAEKDRESNTAFDDEILRRMSDGESLRQICKDLKDFGCPSASRISHRVLDDHPPGFAQRYGRARELQCESWADRIFDEATTPKIGEKTKTLRSEEGKELALLEVTTGDTVDRSRLAVDAMKWLLGKLHPRRYGDMTQTTVNVNERRTVTIEIDPNRNHREQMAERARETLELTNGNGNGHA